MTPLARLLVRRIALNGPMDLSDYMAECLLHPQYGYYVTRDPLGAAGDFTTAPEVSQIFGELIGAAFADWWSAAGRPASPMLVELGPGRGTLAADALRVLRRAAPDLSVHFVEVSPALRSLQSRNVPEAMHHARLEDVPDGPTLLIGNEFVDALPIRAFQRDERGWRARVVGLKDPAAKDDDLQDGALTLGLGPAAHLGVLDRRLADTRPGDIVETRPAADALMATIERRLRTAPGIALLIDYGDWRSLGDTFQALRDHKPENPLAHPGEADLTAHVDFEALVLAVEALPHSLLTPQGVFLERLGATARARVLAARGDPDAVAAAHRRLLHPHEMGVLFKAMAWTSPGLPMLPGLDLPSLLHGARPDRGA